MKKHLVVLGTGFAGIGVLKGLIKHDLLNQLETTFISKTGIFEYLPSAPELVSDKVKPEHIMRDLRDPLRSLGIDFVKASVSSIDPSSMSIALDSGERIKYDYLAVCLGAEPWTPGELPKNASTTYRIWDTMRFRELLKEASGTILIVGAGLTGVEVAGEVVDFSLRSGQDLDIVIVEKLQRPAPCMNNRSAGEKARSFLERRGVKFLLGKGVKEIEEGVAQLEGGDRIEFSAAAWTAGVVPPGPVKILSKKHRRARFLAVDSFLRVAEAENMYAAGDCIHLEIEGKWAAKMAEEAMYQGETIAENIWRDLVGKDLRPHKIRFSTDSPKSLVSLGGGMAIMTYGPKFSFLGRLPYWLKKRIEKKFMKELDNLLSL